MIWWNRRKFYDNISILTDYLKNLVYFLDPLVNPDKREKRPPYTFKSGAVYDGEWKGNVRDGSGE